MRKGLIRKGLVLSVIVLFIFVGVQPVFANEVSISTTSDSDEDCFECQVSDGYSLLKAKLLLNRLKAIVNFVSFKFGDIPEIEEKCEEILDIINSNILLNYPILECAILSILCFTYFAIGNYCILIPAFLYPIFPSLALMLEGFGYYMMGKSDEYFDIGEELDCPFTWSPES